MNAPCDLRLALRSLRTHPGLALAAVLTPRLGIDAVASVQRPVRPARANA